MEVLYGYDTAGGEYGGFSDLGHMDDERQSGGMAGLHLDSGLWTLDSAPISFL